MTFGEKLLLLRKKAGFSQEELGEKLGVSRQAVSRWESGGAMPDSPNLLQISSLFGVAADFLFHDDYESVLDIPIVQETKTEERKNTIFIATSVILIIFSSVQFFLAVTERSAAFLISGILYLVSGLIFAAESCRKQKKTAGSKEGTEKANRGLNLATAILFWCAAVLNFGTVISGGIDYAGFSAVGICNMTAGFGFSAKYLKGRKK